MKKQYAEKQSLWDLVQKEFELAREREVEEIKNRAITDVEETSPNYYTCMRKLGPDKNVKDFGVKK